MARVRVHNFAMSLDGYVAGPDQSLEHLKEGPSSISSPTESRPRSSARWKRRTVGTCASAAEPPPCSGIFEPD